MTGLQILDAMFGVVGMLAVFITACCLIDRRIARKVAAFWAAYVEVHMEASRAFPRLIRERDQQLKRLEVE